MLKRRGLSRALIWAALAATTVSMFANPAAAQSVPGTGLPVATTPSRQVTLVTGDRVALTDDGQVVVQYNAQRKDISFTTFRERGDVYVLPSDTASMVWSGQLDRRLFDLTQLLAYGYNTQNGSMPVIVGYAPGSRTSARAAMTAGGAQVTHELSSMGGLAVRSRHRTATTFWGRVTTRTRQGLRLRDGITKIWLDAKYRTVDEQSTPQVGAPSAWAAGYDGTGQTVAVVDSGIDTTHPDLAGKVTAAANFTSEPDTRDMLGHGTHVASIIAGTGAASGGAQKGVSPGAKLLNSKVCTGNNQCQESDIIAGMQWAVQQGAKLVNMSLGAPDTPGVDPVEQAVNELTASSGALFVVAAGNTGSNYQTLGSPGSADSALTVGAVDKADQYATFSSRGPRLGDSALKPDLAAPGAGIVGARSSTGTFGHPGDTYVTLSGTSMATPHVAGAAAIVRQSHPGWTWAQLKAALMGSADPNPNLDAFTQGAGRLNVGRGYAQSVLADPPSLSLGEQPAPHADDPVLTRTVTYHNYGSASVTLPLSMTTLDPGGAAVASGVFVLSASSVTVPAGGQASVTLTADTRSLTTDGVYTGEITAGSGSTVVRTPFGLNAVAQTYDVALRHVGRSGSAPLAFSTLFLRADGTYVTGIGGGGPDGTASIALLPGTYLVWSTLYDLDAQGRLETTILTKQRLDVGGPASLTLDGRTAGQVRVSVPDPAAQPSLVEVGGELSKIGPGYTSISQLVSNGSTYLGQVDGPNSFVYGFDSKVGVQLADPGPDGDIRNSPHAYFLAWFFDQQLPSGLTRNLGTGDLATVTAHHAAQFSGTVGYKSAVPEPSQYMFLSSVNINQPMDLPRQRLESFNTEQNVRFSGTFEEQDPAGTDVEDLVGNLTSYAAGATSRENWNHPVYGPAFTSTVSPVNWVVRSGDTIATDVPLFGDGDGHAGHAGDTVSSGVLTLKRNGSVVGRRNLPSPNLITFSVPSDFSSYELDVSMRRTAPVVLSTSVDAAWTFTSASVDPHSLLRLQMWAVSFHPTLNAANTAPAGGSFTIPLTVAPQPGAATSSVRSVTVDYSTDDGATWRPATVSSSNGAYTATVSHPNAAGFVSLRAHAEDWAGNTVTESVVRAYQIAPGA